MIEFLYLKGLGTDQVESESIRFLESLFYRIALLHTGFPSLKKEQRALQMNPLQDFQKRW